MDYITVAGKKYSVTKDGFGITYIDGKLLNDWMDSLPPEARLEVAHHGAKTVFNKPIEYLVDIMDDVEMPEEQRQLLLSMRKAVRGVSDN